MLISQATVLTLIASGLQRGSAPIYPLGSGEVSDPLSQAMALTAIVIGLAVTALALALVVRVVDAFRSEDIDDVAEEEAQRDAKAESAEGLTHEAEEEAAL
jgi:multicomponent Na+:H+ antiporter subunit C